MVVPTKGGDVLILDDPKTEKTTMIKVDTRALHYVRAPFIYSSDL